MRKTRLLLVDENDDFLDGLCAWLSESRRFEVAGVAHSGQEAAERAARLLPDVVLMDLRLPDGSGLEATRRIKARAEPPWVVLMGFHVTAAIRAEARKAGADRCLSKHGITKELALVIDSLSASHGREPEARGTGSPFEDDARGGSTLLNKATRKEGGRP